MKYILILCGIVLSTIAGDWVTSGGDPARTGLSDEIGPAGPDTAWHGTTSGLFGLPIFISGDRMVTSRFQAIDNSPIVCQSLDDGRVLWTRGFPGTNSRSIPVGFRDGRVYAMKFQESGHDTLFALNPQNGATLWRSRMTLQMSITESVTFCDNGDLLVQGSDFRIARVSADNGDTVWTCYRIWPVTGSTDLCVYGNAAYGYFGTMQGIWLIAIDLAAGTIRDSIRLEDTHPGGPLPQAAPMVGPDGKIYAHVVADNVTAIHDTGDTLEMLWVREISSSPYCPFAHFAVGPDSTVYIGSHGRIFRLDPADGSALDSSPPINDGNLFSLRLAIGADGTVYASNGGFTNGALFALSPSLDILWSLPVTSINTSGPAIGPDGLLAVSGNGTNLIALKTMTGIAHPTPDRPTATGLSATPNPFHRFTRLSVPKSADARTIAIYDRTGRLVNVIDTKETTLWNGSDDAGRPLAPGAYFCRAGTQTCCVVLTR